MSGGSYSLSHWERVGVGIESFGNMRYLRNENALNNAIGFKITGDGNTIHNGSATYNGKRSNGTLYPAGPNVGVGVYVNGNNNVITDTNAQYNTSHGFQVIGNSNQVLKVSSGDVSGRGNGGDGLNLSGDSNLLQENTTRTNSLDGIRIVSGTGNRLKKNVSGGTTGQNSGDCEFEVVAGNIDLGENKSNNVLVPGAVYGPFPTGCTGSP